MLRTMPCVLLLVAMLCVPHAGAVDPCPAQTCRPCPPPIFPPRLVPMVKVKAMEIEVNGKPIRLTEDEANELIRVLTEAFGYERYAV